MSERLSYFPFQRGTALRAVLLVFGAWLLAVLWRGSQLPEQIQLGFSANGLLSIERWLWLLAFAVGSFFVVLPMLLVSVLVPRLSGNAAIRFPGADYWLATPQRRRAVLHGLAAVFLWVMALELIGSIVLFELVFAAQAQTPAVLALPAVISSAVLMLVLPQVLLIWAVLQLRRRERKSG